MQENVLRVLAAARAAVLALSPQSLRHHLDELDGAVVVRCGTVNKPTGDLELCTPTPFAIPNIEPGVMLIFTVATTSLESQCEIEFFPRFHGNVWGEATS
mgnify:CR=1 FL=1